MKLCRNRILNEIGLPGGAGASPLDEPGLDLLRTLRTDDQADDGLSHESVGADMLRRLIFLDLKRVRDGSWGWGCWTIWDGGGSLTNSGRLRRASGSFMSGDCNGCDSRMNSGRVSKASGSFVLGCWSTASWPWNLPAPECRISCSTKASR
jgi:hypothetical protein